MVQFDVGGQVVLLEAGFFTYIFVEDSGISRDLSEMLKFCLLCGKLWQKKEEVLDGRRLRVTELARWFRGRNLTYKWLLMNFMWLILSVIIISSNRFRRDIFLHGKPEFL